MRSDALGHVGLVELELAMHFGALCMQSGGVDKEIYDGKSYIKDPLARAFFCYGFPRSGSDSASCDLPCWLLRSYATEAVPVRCLPGCF